MFFLAVIEAWFRAWLYGVSICSAVFRIRKFLGDPDPLARGTGSFHHQAKIVRKNFISTLLWLLYDLLSLKNDVNVPSKSNKQKKTGEKFFFFFASWRLLTKRAGGSDPNQDPLVRGTDPDLDPYQNVTDPEHFCRWWIRLADCYCKRYAMASKVYFHTFSTMYQ